MRVAPKLYQLARTVNTLEVLLSCNPVRILRRLKNIIIGRSLAKTGFYKIFK